MTNGGMDWPTAAILAVFIVALLALVALLYYMDRR